MTTSLETAKLLKKNGFPQNTEWSWAESSSVSADRLVNRKDFASCIVKNWFSAPTTDELLAEMPEVIDFKRGKAVLVMGRINGFYEVSYRCFENKIAFRNRIFAECLAKMWLHLKREGLLKG